MAYLKRNYKYLNGTKIPYSYRVHFSLPAGKYHITLRGITDKKIANQLKSKANTIEQRAILFPNDKDWLQEMYITLGRLDKVPEYNTLIPTIKVGFQQMIAEKIRDKECNSKQTLETYSSGLKLLIDTTGDILVNQISAMHEPKYHAVTEKNKWADTTINIRSRVVMMFFKWCLAKEYINKIPFTIKQRTVPLKENHWIPQADFDTILSHMPNQYAVWCKVAYYTGLRLCELRTNPEHRLFHTIKRVDDAWQLDVRGKGGRRRLNILPDWLYPDYKIMISKQYHHHTISKHFKKACRLAGFDTHYFHEIRHSCGSNLLLNKVDFFTVSKVMGHSNPKTTIRYTNDITLGWEKLLETQRTEA